MTIHSRRASEKSQLELDPHTPEDSDIETHELEDVIAPLSPVKSVRRRVRLGICSLLLELTCADESINAPPSFAESQFATIVRRQKPRDTALKISNVPTRYPNLPRDFEFAGYRIFLNRLI
jgi:hypothetical protein